MRDPVYFRVTRFCFIKAYAKKALNKKVKKVSEICRVKISVNFSRKN